MTPAARADTLTRRQLEALELAAEGLTNAEIAGRLGCGSGTVRAHIFDACKRLGVSSRVEAFVALGWLRPQHK